MVDTADSAPTSSLPVPAYLLDHDDPAALFTRLQRVGIHLELLQAEAMSGLDLRFGDFVILATLRKEPAPHELPVSQIAAYILRPMGSISQVLDRLERTGLVARAHDVDDRRKVIVSLTADGTTLVDQALNAYKGVRQRIFDRLTGAELDAIDEALTTLLVALDTDYEENQT